MLHFNNDEFNISLKKGEHWLDRPVLALKDLYKSSKAREKVIKKQTSKNASTSINNHLEKASKLLGSFLKTLKTFKKKKNSRRDEFWFDMQVSLNEEVLKGSDPFQESVTKAVRRSGDILLKELRRHLQDSSHWINILLTSFFKDFWKIYNKIWDSELFEKVLEQWKRVTSEGFTTSSGDSLLKIDSQILSESNSLVLVEKCFYDIKTAVNLIVETVPLYYSELISKNLFCLIKEDLTNYVMCEYIRGDSYNILFTFSRVATWKEEEQLYKCIKKACLHKSSRNTTNFNLLEDLYCQIHPDFRVVQIENEEDSSSNSIWYNPKYMFESDESREQQGDDSSEPTYFQLKYENGAEKLSTLNHWQSPMEKILMFKWVSESIKQDSQVCLDNSKSPLYMCCDTMVSIFAYIIALSQNHLLFAHLFLTKHLVTKDLKYLAHEGYYLWILEAALNLLWEYPDKTEELMVSINHFEDSLKVNTEKREEDYESVCETAPTPTLRRAYREFKYSFCEPDDSVTKQQDFYISKSFFDFN